MKVLPAREDSTPTYHELHPKRNFAAGIFLIMSLLTLASGANALAQGLTPYEEEVLKNLSAPRALATMRDLSRVVVTETSGLGKGTVVSGSNEERIFAAAIAKKMSSFGLDVRQETFPVRSFDYGLVKLVAGGKSIDAVTLHSGGGTWGEIDGIRYAIGNRDDGRTLQAALVDVGGGSVDDYERIGNVEGKIVLVQRGPTPVWPSYLITEAAQRGAAAMIIYDYSQTSLDEAIRQDSVWYRDMIPIVSISNNSANSLKNQLKDKAVTVSLENRADASYGTSQNVVGVLRGSELTDEWVIISAHYDRWFNSDVDNNIGSAVVLELAEVLSKNHKPLRNIMFIAYGSEEAGAINTTYDWLAGSYAFVKAHPEIMSRLVLAFNFDGAGWAGEHGKVVATPDNTPFQRELVSALGLQDRLDVESSLAAALDSWTMGAIGGGAVADIRWVFSPGNDDSVSYGSFYHTQLDVHADSQFDNLGIDLRLGALGAIRASSNIRVPISLLEVANWVTEGLVSDQKRLSDSGADASIFDPALHTVQVFRNRAATIETSSAAIDDSREKIVQMNRRLLKTRHELVPWLQEHSDFTSRVRTHTQVGNIVAIRGAIAAAKAGDADAAAKSLAKVDSMQWGQYLSNDAYKAERLMWLEPSGWRSEYEQSAMQVDPQVHHLFTLLNSGDSNDEVIAGLTRLEAQSTSFLRDALFIIAGKLNAATDRLSDSNRSRRD